MPPNQCRAHCFPAAPGLLQCPRRQPVPANSSQLQVFFGNPRVWSGPSACANREPLTPSDLCASHSFAIPSSLFCRRPIHLQPPLSSYQDAEICPKKVCMRRNRVAGITPHAPGTRSVARAYGVRKAPPLINRNLSSGVFDIVFRLLRIVSLLL